MHGYVKARHSIHSTPYGHHSTKAIKQITVENAYWCLSGQNRSNEEETNKNYKIILVSSLLHTYSRRFFYIKRVK
jgi:hypothetical protein